MYPLYRNGYPQPLKKRPFWQFFSTCGNMRKKGREGKKKEKKGKKRRKGEMKIIK